MSNVSTDKRFVIEPAREIPVAADVDVLVAGGGTAGLAAAITAAREGASTLLVERHASLGGTPTANLVTKYSQHREVLYGFSAEIVDKLVQRNAAVSGRVINFDPEGLKKLAIELVEEAGVKLLLYTWVVAPIVESNVLRGVFIENKSGRQAILAKTTIDCTGDADVACMAGVPVRKGRDGDGAMRPMTLPFRMGGIDFKAMVDYARRNPQEFSPDPNRQVNDIEQGVLRMWGFFGLIKEARKNGDLPEGIQSFELEGIDVERGICYTNEAQAYGLDGTNAWDLTTADTSARAQIPMLLAFVRKYIPGCRNAYIIQTAPAIGVRETRHIEGEYTMNEEDCAQGRAFEDRVVGGSTHIVQPGVAVHTPDFHDSSIEDPYHTMIPPERKFFIPYRSMVPLKIDGLLVAGRAISMTHEADGWARSQVWCMGQGQAVGTAAALAAKSGVNVRSLDINRLQTRLRSQGVPLGESEAFATA